MATAAGALLALDIDGTLVTFEGFLSEPTRLAVREAVAAGHEVVVCTGRPLAGALGIVERLGLDVGYVVSSNGAVVSRYDFAEEPVVDTLNVRTFDPSQAIAAISAELPTAAYAVEDVHGNYRVHGVFEPHELGGALEHFDGLAELSHDQATRVSVKGSEAEFALFDEIARRFGFSGATYSFGRTTWIDVAPAGVSKGFAMELIRNRTGIHADNTWAVGDGSNDIPMLDWAAHAIAMGGASPAVVKAADRQVAGPESHGVAEAVSMLLGHTP